MEFVLVTFERLRGVFMDGMRQGQTGQVIGVEAGHHDFDLGSPEDYAPSSVPAVVMGTTPTQPMIVPFHPLPDVMALPSAAPVTKRKAGKKKVQHRTTKKKRAKKPVTSRKRRNTKPRRKSPPR